MLHLWNTAEAQAIDYGESYEHALAADQDRDEAGFETASVLEDDLNLD
jgi:hypothetical protein